MRIKLFDSELCVMKLLWKEGEMPAAEISKQLNKSIGWNKNTTYTVIKKCIEKGAIERKEPKFICHPLITESETQAQETTELINKMFGGSRQQFLSAFLTNEKMDTGEIAELKNLIKKLK